MSQLTMLKDVKVVELATFIAVPAATRILADMGATVIKIEGVKGDNLRWTAPTEGRPLDHNENTTFDLENANKMNVGLDIKTAVGKKILFEMLEKADVFVTNWRPQALARAELSYEILKKRFPKLVYANATGYGEKGPDKDLPGFDYTAFFARGGILGTLYQKGTVPMNVIPGLGDHQCGMMLAAGILAAYINAQRTGKGEKVSTSLLHTAAYIQGIMLQGAQYPEYGQTYPIDRRTTISPFIVAYKTKDDRFVQVCMPVYDAYYATFIKCIGREDLAFDERYTKMEVVAKNKRSPELYDILCEQLLKKTGKEWAEIFTANDIPFALAQTWEELLQDEQAWAIDVFYKMKYPNGNERALVRIPICFEDAGLPAYNQAVTVGHDNYKVLGELGYSKEQVDAMIEKKEVCAW